MRYRSLGHTGIRVSSLALGATDFGRMGRITQEEVTAIVDAALTAGINLIDTADAYGGGQSEKTVGKAIAGRREDIMLATKTALPMGGPQRPGQLASLAGHRAGQQPAPVTTHPAVTAAVIGPPMLEHLGSQLAAADTILSADVLDAVDAIVAPGADLALAEKNDTQLALLDAAGRRRPAA
ncbi:aldo/keto reductase [Micromonospora sp. URMC 105]|uniref:aldo/keto reductase n=1 Tax=Micromonospora sp. URMC 105 TaxID=3423413 RepID=UPI003F1C245F